MDDSEKHLWFQSFDCESVPLGPNERAAPRPPGRPRPPADDAGATAPSFQSFDCESVPLPSDAGPDAAFATELAGRVLEYVRAHPSGTVEELAALMRQLLARRSA